MSKNFDVLKELKHWKEINTEKGVTWIPVFVVEAVEKALLELKAIKETNSSEALECLKNFVENNEKGTYSLRDKKDIDTTIQALQRLDKYEQILGSGRLTDRNYKNTTLDLDSCKPYIRLGQLEDIYEESKKNG